MQRTLPVVLLVAAALAGCGGGDDGADDAPAPKRGVADQIASFAFVPEDIVVKTGGSVTWTNRDKAPHTAETDPGTRGAFDTGRLDRGESKAIRFRTAGKFRFYCVYHRFMVGTVDVRK